jgi:hypothetical protein
MRRLLPRKDLKARLERNPGNRQNHKKWSQSMPDAKKPADKTKKPGFTIPKLSETQWAMVAGAVLFVGYLGYSFVTAPTAPQVSGATTFVQPTVNPVESAERKFKRESQNAKLPDGSAIPLKEVEEKTQLTQQVPFGDKELEFQVRLPKNWVMSQFARYGLPGEENYSVLTNIARYFGPAIEDQRPFLWVEAERENKYMTAETWARAYMIKRGIAPQTIETSSSTDTQVLYVDVRDFQSYAMRTLFHVEGDTMVLISFGVPIQSYKDYKDMMALSLNSFKILRPINRQIEEIKDYRLLSVLKFKYYASWLPKNEFTDSTLHPSVELHNPQVVNNEKNDVLQGLVLINIWRKTEQFSPKDNMQAITDRLQELSMTIKAPLEPPKALPLRDDFIKITQAPYTALVNTYIRKDQFDIIKSEESKTQQEVWITTLDNGYYVAYLTLITPLQTTNYLVWAQNMAAYELLINSLDVRNAPKNDD